VLKRLKVVRIPWMNSSSRRCRPTSFVVVIGGNVTRCSTATVTASWIITSFTVFGMSSGFRSSFSLSSATPSVVTASLLQVLSPAVYFFSIYGGIQLLMLYP
jgi:hypothetical protein